MVVKYARNSFSSIDLMYKKPLEKFLKLRILLGQMIPMIEVIEVMENDVLKLTLEF